MRLLVTFLLLLFTGLSLYAQRPKPVKPLPPEQQKKQAAAKAVQQNGKVEKKYPNGMLMYEGVFAGGRPVGEFKRYHPNGKPMAILNYNTFGEADAELFSEEGVLYAKGRYKGQLRNGTWTFYNEAGKTILTENYKDGKKEGFSISYYNNGKPIEKIKYLDDMRQGLYTRYHENGNPAIEIMYNEDKPHGKVRYCYPNGEIRIEGQNLNGVRDGKWKLYNRQGRLQQIITYKNGVGDNEEELLQQENEVLLYLEEQKGKFVEPEDAIEDGLAREQDGSEEEQEKQE